MKLTEKQIEAFDRDGVLVIEELFNKEEVTEMKSGILSFENDKLLDNVICEENGDVRSVFAPDKTNATFHRTSRDARLIAPANDLLREDIYLYQYKLNLKRAFSGKAWEWHQDFAYWQLDDGVPNPDMLSVMLYLDDTRSYQGPLVVIPGSHKYGVVEFNSKIHLDGTDNLMNSLGADLKYTVHERNIRDLADQCGIQVIEGKAGTAIFFHSNLFHSSWGNLSPYSRDTAILTYNSVNNLPKFKDKRPDYLCARDYTPIVTEMAVI